MGYIPTLFEEVEKLNERVKLLEEENKKRKDEIKWLKRRVCPRMM